MTPDRRTDPIFFPDAAGFRRWLQAHARHATELLVGYHKVATGRPCMTWSESVDEALCFGWIDGVRRRIDDETYQIRFTPRRRSSTWSAVNIAKYHRLKAEGRTTAAGDAAFEARTEARSAVYSYEQAIRAELSTEELREFRRHASAWRFFEDSPPSHRQATIHWICGARKPETRRRRFLKLLEACVLGRRLR